MGWAMAVAGSTSGVSPKSIRRPSSTLLRMLDFANESEVANADLLSHMEAVRPSGLTGDF